MGELLEKNYAEDEFGPTIPLDNIPVVNEDGTPYVPKWYEKIDDWCFDHLWFYSYGYRIWKEYLCPSAIKRMIKFFFQRRIRGFDDSETWNLDMQFYKWVYPRLKRFAEISIVYPTNYDNSEDWKKELHKRIIQLEYIINTNEFEFNNWNYIPEFELKNLEKKGCSELVVNSIAYDYLVKDFNAWFAENLQKLWW